LMSTSRQLPTGVRLLFPDMDRRPVALLAPTENVPRLVLGILSVGSRLLTPRVGARTPVGVRRDLSRPVLLFLLIGLLDPRTIVVTQSPCPCLAPSRSL
jgi:hypothetical protein